MNESIASVRQALSAALQAAHRDEASLRLLAVSKGQSARDILRLYQTGQRAFGENYLQEALVKQAELSQLHDLEWHFIGAIQRNKTRDIARCFSFVQSVESELIAKRLNDARATLPHEPRLNVCIQVNVPYSSRKHGVTPDKLLALLHAMLQLPHLRVRGLMAYPDPEAGSKAFEAVFACYRECQAALTRDDAEWFDTLSMGTSTDYKEAILNGATMVRIGNALFGSRVL